MTEKELAYIEDATMHEQSIIKICTETLNNLQDDNLKNFIQEEISKHEETESSLISLLEAHANE